MPMSGIPVASLPPSPLCVKLEKEEEEEEEGTLHIPPRKAAVGWWSYHGWWWLAIFSFCERVKGRLSSFLHTAATHEAEGAGP